MNQEQMYLVTTIVFLTILFLGYILLSIPSFIYGKRLNIKSKWCLFFPILRMIPMTKMAKLNKKSKSWYYTFVISAPILSVLLSILLGGISFMIYFFFYSILDTFLYAKILRNGNVNVPIRTFVNISSGGLGFIGAKPDKEFYKEQKETSLFDLETI